MMKVFVFSCVYLFIPLFLLGQLSSETYISWQKRIQYNLSILDREGQLARQLSITDKGIYIYASVQDKQRNKPEIFLAPDEIPPFVAMCREFSQERLAAAYSAKGTKPWKGNPLDGNTYRPWRPQQGGNTPLTGLRVALDPGHLGNTLELAELEGKYVKVRPTDSRPGMAFWEGDLTLATAHIVRKELEKLGATVMMTRQRPGQSAMGPLYADWRKNFFLADVEKEVKAGRLSSSKAKFWRTDATENDIYRRFFNILDLRARADKINDFQPHLTLIIHYNVDKDNWDRRDREGFFEPGFANYSMAFVPGNLGVGNLRTLKGRVNFLRLLVGPYIRESVRLSATYLKANTHFTHVPIVDKQEEPDYLIDRCTPTPETGVYGRDLALTRLVNSPLCYGESLCQDNWRELMWLDKRNMVVGEITTSTRVRLVADAYVQAVKEFVGVEVGE